MIKELNEKVCLLLYLEKELSSLSEKKDKRLLGKATSRFTQTVLERKQKKYKSCDQ